MLLIRKQINDIAYAASRARLICDQRAVFDSTESPPLLSLSSSSLGLLGQAAATEGGGDEMPAAAAAAAMSGLRTCRGLTIATHYKTPKCHHSDLPVDTCVRCCLESTPRNSIELTSRGEYYECQD